MTTAAPFVVREVLGRGDVKNGTGARKASTSPMLPLGLSRLVLGDALVAAPFLPAGQVNLVYLDPPFSTGRERRGRASPEGKSLSYGDQWEGGLGAYLDWLAGLLGQAHRILGPTGSLVLHLDWRASHAARLLLDAIFGPERFINEIVWHYGSGGRASRHFHRKHDALLWYARGPRHSFYSEAVSVPRSRCPSCGQERQKWNNMRRTLDTEGRTYRTIRSGGREYRYYDDEPVLPPDVWLDISHLQQRDPERLGWPTQKPLALLRRIVAATTAPGDLVADLCAGSGTTLEAAQLLGRRFLGMDISPEAVALSFRRLVASTPPVGPGLSLETCGVHGWDAGALEEALAQGALSVDRGQVVAGRARKLILPLLGAPPVAGREE